MADFTVVRVPECEVIGNVDDPEMDEAYCLTDMVDEFLHYGQCDTPEVSAFARRLGVMV
jgi:hypothetical protein